MGMILVWSAFLLGAFVCLLNFYLSFLRYHVHRLRRLTPQSYRWVSGLPMIGSLLVGLSLFGLHSRPVLVALAIASILIDTAGPVWFVGVQIYQSVHKKNRN